MITELQRDAEFGSLDLRTDCRTPKDGVEQTIYRRRSPIPHANVCLLRQAPRRLAGWSCEHEMNGKAKSLTCWEVIPEDVDQEIRANGDYYGPIVARYLAGANTCPQSMRDAAPQTLNIPQALTAVAKGGKTMFVEKLNSGRTVHDILMEGYAPLAGVSESDGSFVHYIMVGADWIEPAHYGPVVKFIDHDEPWQITDISQSHDYQELQKGLSARLPAGMALFTYAVEIRRITVTPRSDERRRSLVDLWASDLSDQFDDFDYEDLSDAKMRELIGIDTSDFKDRMKTAAPPGLASEIGDQISDDMYFKMKRGPTCDTDESPNMMLGIMPMYPISGDKESYGSILLYGVVGSPCQSDIRRLQNLQQRAMKEAMGRLQDKIRSTN